MNGWLTVVEEGLSEKVEPAGAAVVDEPNVDSSGTEFDRDGLGLGVHVRPGFEATFGIELMSADRRPRCGAKELGGMTPPKPEGRPGAKPMVNDEMDVALCVRTWPWRGLFFFWSFAGVGMSTECRCVTTAWMCACAARVDSVLGRPAGVCEWGM